MSKLSLQNWIRQTWLRRQLQKPIVGGFVTLFPTTTIDDQPIVIIDTANADHPKGVGAMIAGLERRKAVTGKPSIIIHVCDPCRIAPKLTSNSALVPVLSLTTQGGSSLQKRCKRWAVCVPGTSTHLCLDSYEDIDCSDIRAIPLTYVHRSTQDVVVAASERGAVRGYVVMPPLICE